MTESDALSATWVSACKSNKVDEIWVPSHFHVEVFTKSGVPKEKVQRIPLSLDIHLWDPAVTTPMALEGRKSNQFAFLSVFKWEHVRTWEGLFDNDVRVVDELFLDREKDGMFY